MEPAVIDLRHRAIARLKAVADEMRFLSDRMARSRDHVAVGSLASAARAAWTNAQCVLVQAEVGLLSMNMIDRIAAPVPGVTSAGLQQLRLSTLRAAEGRLPPVETRLYAGLSA